MRFVLSCILVISGMWGALAAASAPKTIEAKFSRAPLPAGVRAGWQHGPFAAGECNVCHERNDTKNPGRVLKTGPSLCLECHPELEALRSEKYVHAPVFADCTRCHNPHESAQRGMLHTESVYALCTSCHAGVKKDAETAVVKHEPVATGRACLSCHSPHAAKAPKLLSASGADQCLGCHSRPGLADDNGVPLTNFKQLLADSKVLHDPFASNDCSACHAIHGGENFRMLTAAYPQEFYASYDPRKYALCFGCHDEKTVSQPETTTLTGFRDGSRNLHFVHVNKAERGRTCRACHEVHASRHAHLIRDAVPYGTRSWMLKVGFEPTPTGGTCAKTCHDAKSYVNRAAVNAGR